jgi:phosphoadenosine phosphosulfate reductase
MLMKTGAILLYKNFLSNILKKINGAVALAFSHQQEDAAVLDMLLKCGIRGSFEVFTLDTLKLFPETYAFNQEVERFFGVSIKSYTPNIEIVQELERELGEYGVRDSVENRKKCCRIRKVDGLKAALAGKSAWITGLRAAQSVTRRALEPLEYDSVHELIKINPIAHLSDEELASYTKDNNLPVHPLYQLGYKSIGCACCTRPVKADEDARAGRWWWEEPDKKECGLHLREG